MVAVGVGAELVLYLVSLEVRETASLEDAVLGHGAVPHQVAAGLHVVRVRKQAAHVHNGVAHDGQGHVVGDVVAVRGAEIGLHRVAEGVKRAGEHLHARHGGGIGGVERGEAGRGGKNAALPVLRLVRDDRAAVHLAAGTRAGDDDAHGDAIRGELAPDVLIVPDVLVQHGLGGYDLAAV